MRRFCSFIVAAVLICSMMVQPAAALEDAALPEVAEVPASAETVTLPAEPATLIDTPPPIRQENPPTAPSTEAVIPVPAPVAPQASPVQIVEPVVTPPVSPAPQPLAVSMSEPVVVSAFRITPGRGFDFVEIKNTTDDMASVNGMTIHLLYSTTTSDYDCQVSLNGYARPNSYVAYSTQVGNDGAYVLEGCPQPGAPLFDKEIRVMRGSEVIESVRIAASDMLETAPKQWERKAFTASGRTGILATDFKVSTRDMYTSGLYEPAPEPTIQFLEIFPRAIECSSGDASPVCRPYIKIKNTGTADIDLSKFRLRNGALTAQSSRFNTSVLAGIVPAGEFATISVTADGKPLALNGEDGATWLEDSYGVRTYPNLDMPYSDAELVAQKGRSWAFDSSDATWKWATPAPMTEANDFRVIEPGKGSAGETETTLKPCRDDQYRSEETNRCRSLTSSGSTLTPCKEGQYRSEETNRCRSIAAAAKADLKPCRDDQYRSEETNRCRTIASLASSLKPCKDNQYRSEETNRCRNIQAVAPPAAAYAVEPIAQGAKAFVGWWALGGVLLCALGYAAWEWRSEIRRGLGRLAHVFHRSK